MNKKEEDIMYAINVICLFTFITINALNFHSHGGLQWLQHIFFWFGFMYCLYLHQGFTGSF